MEGLHYPVWKTYSKVAVTKTEWYWHIDRHIDKWNRIEIPEIKSNIYGQLTFNKCTTWFYKERIAFLTNDSGITGNKHSVYMYNPEILLLAMYAREFVCSKTCT